VAFFPSYLIKHLFTFRAEKTSEGLPGHTSSSFQMAGSLTGIQGTPGPVRHPEQTRLWLVSTDGFLKGAQAESLALAAWLRKSASL